MSDLRAHRLKRAKRALRRAILAERDAIPEADRFAHSEAIAGRFLGLPETAGAETVLAFWSFGSEVETGPLIARLRSLGKTVALPRVEGNEVAPVVATPETPMTEASFGAWEPADGRALDVTELDLVVVPGVAFDRSCGRVGYGGGYYDRLLGRRRDGVAAIAIAFALQVVDRVPSGAIDRRIDGVVTEVEVIRCR
ncbi:MAG TPA: 5-formyltetrahydrofolate cyclo-ligase [Actinomycetota bacterium]|nr:5-formyltetrahydrofolate cyclo-ligase [Actinomycetota bacterium]